MMKQCRRIGKTRSTSLGHPNGHCGRHGAVSRLVGDELAFIIHSFNRVTNVDPLAFGIRQLEYRELIVCDDGSLDGSREKWAGHLSAPNEFLVCSNDLHEIRILDRAVRFSQAEVICLLQDDDAIPDDHGWVDRAMERFARFPDLAVIGGFMGFNSCRRSPIESRDASIWGDESFQFVWHVNIGPYFIRRTHYEALGGWDFAFSDCGEPGIGFDSELCLRAWLSGFQVGYQFVPVKGTAKNYALSGGTMLFSKDLRFRNQWRNHKKLFRIYNRHAAEISARVGRANQAISDG